MEENLVKIAVTNVSRADQIKGLLRNKGIELQILIDESHCTTGCGLSVELWAKQEDIPKIQEAFEEEHVASLSGLEYDPTLLNQVFDPEKETAICPACGHEFSTKESECPECGLHF